MQMRAVLSRRSLVSLCGMLCVGCVVAASAAAGSTLPEGARFQQRLEGGGGVTVAVGGKGVSVTLAQVPIKCAGSGSREARVGIGLSSTIAPKVGRTINLEKTRQNTGAGGKGTSSSTTEVTLQFKSAQQVVVAIHQEEKSPGKAACEGSASYKVPRQS